MHTVPAQFPATGKCSLAFVGEAPGVEEVARGRPFVGPSGRLHNRILGMAGIERDATLTTNVFDFELPHNMVKPICVPKAQCDQDPTWPQLAVPVDSGAYVPATIAVPQLERLYAELLRCDPNIIVTLGGTALWALAHRAPYGQMKKIRGTILGTARHKILPTYHPAYVVRNYAMLPIVLADYRKALRESRTKTLPDFKIHADVAQTPDHVERFLQTIHTPAAVDIETLKGHIDCIGFATDLHYALTVPIFNPDGTNYWFTDTDEIRVMQAIKRYMEDPTRIKVMQNGSYDAQWMHEKWGIHSQGWFEDTRLLHHALWPECPKDLGTQASLHLTLPPWKLSTGGRIPDKSEG